MNGNPSLAQKVLLTHGALEEAGIGHAFGGALALAYYGEPRVTIDIDINVFVSSDMFDAVARALEPLGVNTDADVKRVEKDEQIRLWWGDNPIDLFFAYDPLHEAMKIDARRVEFGTGTISILAPEHLIVCKVIFDRPKDWVDIEQMVIAETVLDREEILRWLERILPASDERIERFSLIWDQTR